MKLKELLKNISVTDITADPEMEIQDIRYDSRRVEAGDLFVAVEGFQSNGYDYIYQAVENGAAAVLCQRLPEQSGIPYILTADSRLALALASGAYFGDPSKDLVMIGITGTNGKTTSALLIKHMLEDCLGVQVGLVGTVSNWIGERELPAVRTTPESYDLQKLLREMVDSGCTYGVMEVSSHALALGRTAGIFFQAGLFTNLTQDHLDFHKTLENYAEAKALLFSQCGKAAVNLDDPWAEFMTERAACPVIGFGMERTDGMLAARDISYTAVGVHFSVVAGGESVPVSLSIPGKFSISNALTVLAAASILDIPLQDAAASLGRAQGVKGRVEVVPTPDDFSVIIDYAHTPDALEKVLQTMKAVAEGRVVVLFGCGGDRDSSKRSVMGRIAAEQADFAIVTSDNPRTEDPYQIIEDIVSGMPAGAAMMVIPDRRQAIAWAINHHEKGDIIVLAGKGHETYQEVNGVRSHMDEREIVAEVLKENERGTV